MTHRLRIIFLLLVACGPNPGATDSGPSSTSSSSDDTTASETTGLETSQTGTTAGPETTETETTAGIPCQGDEECPEPIEICIEGVCANNPAICDQTKILQVDFIPPRVLVVFDKSSSMFRPETFWDNDGDDLDDDGFQDEDPMQMATPKVSRWSTAHEVLSIVYEGWPDQKPLGALLFPHLNAPVEPGPMGCVVSDSPEVPVASGNLEPILSAIPPVDAVNFGGHNPATAALEVAYTHLQAGEEPGSKMVIFVTDGLPDCAADAPPENLHLFDEALVPRIEQARQNDILTVIVGIDISTQANEEGIVAADILNAAGLAGGLPSWHPTEKYFNAQRLDDFALLFESPDITIDCVLELDWPSGSEIDVYLNGQSVPQIDPENCNSQAGFFTHEDSDPFAVELCGEACALYQELDELDVLLHCPSP